jgi:hypothetical protein
MKQHSRWDELHATEAGSGMRSPFPAREALTLALRRVLQPLVRLMVARGITFSAAAEVLKRAYIDVADQHFRLTDERQTDSRVSLITGLHRKDVKRLRTSGNDRGVQLVPPSVSLGEKIVTAWTNDPRYSDAQGRARPLPRLARHGGEASFEALVAAVSKDIRSRAVLDEWTRLGIARIDEEDRVCLNSEAFVPRDGEEEKAFYLGHNVRDHLAAATHNVLGEAPPFLERSVHYSGLTIEAIEAIAKTSERLGMSALKSVQREALAKDVEIPNDGSRRARFTFGVYFYCEPLEDEANPASRLEPSRDT